MGKSDPSLGLLDENCDCYAPAGGGDILGVFMWHNMTTTSEPGRRMLRF
jgi:hypothetical protein